MYTKEALIDIHTRAHLSFARYFDHLASFSEEELRRELEGFGVGCLLDQIDHMIGAEEYWVSVAEGKTFAGEEAPAAPLATLKAERERVAANTRRYIDETSEEALNSRSEMMQFNGVAADLIPAQIILRTQTHLFNHFGQLSAICRLLGKPIPQGLDFSLRE